jgi:hypothetical protein
VQLELPWPTSSSTPHSPPACNQRPNLASPRRTRARLTCAHPQGFDKPRVPIVRAALVDEYRIVVAPTAVGGGTPFFPTLPSWISLRLLEDRTFPGGTVLLRYEAKHD